MNGVAAHPQSRPVRDQEMPLIVWLIGGAGVWLAAIGATCPLLAMSKRGPRCEGLSDDDAAGLVEPRISAIAIDVREPGLATRTSAIAPGRPDRRRPQPPPSRVDVDRSASGDSYALHVRGDVVARLHWRTGRG